MDEEEERLLRITPLLDPVLREARELRALGGLAGDVARRGVRRARERPVVGRDRLVEPHRARREGVDRQNRQSNSCSERIAKSKNH